MITRELARLDGLQLLFGEASAAQARLYARLPGEAAAPWRLTGSVEGPYSRYAQTLPARVSLASRANEGSLLAEAVLPDPCFWTPACPLVYRARVELRHGTELIETVDRQIGIRPLGVRGRRLVFDGQSWVLRGVEAERVEPAALPAWRDAAAAMVVASPDDALCREASEVGVLIVARVAGSAAEVASELLRLSRHAAVGFVEVASAEPLPTSLREIAPNAILAQRLPAADAGGAADWAHVVVQMVDDVAADYADRQGRPVLALRPVPAKRELPAARALCDHLQRDLAGRGAFAGYMV